MWCADLDHGQIFDLVVWRVRLESEILKQARAGKSSTGDARMANTDRNTWGLCMKLLMERAKLTDDELEL